MTAHDFQLVTHAIAVGVVQAAASAVVEFHGKLTFVGICCVHVVVACLCILTAHDFQLVANAIAVGVVQAGARAVVKLLRVLTVCRIRGGIVVVAGHFILTSHNLQFVTHTVSIRVTQAHAIAVVEVLRVHTCAVVLSRHRAEVAGCFIGATDEVAHAIPIRILHAVALAIE